MHRLTAKFAPWGPIPPNQSHFSTGLTQTRRLETLNRTEGHERGREKVQPRRTRPPSSCPRTRRRLFSLPCPVKLRISVDIFPAPTHPQTHIHTHTHTPLHAHNAHNAHSSLSCIIALPPLDNLGRSRPLRLSTRIWCGLKTANQSVKRKTSISAVLLIAGGSHWSCTVAWAYLTRTSRFLGCLSGDLVVPTSSLSRQ